MKRTLLDIQKSHNQYRHLYVDEENAREIMAFLQANKRYSDKFSYNVDIILNHKPTREIFEKENISKAIDDVYAIKLFKGSENIRIYCKCYDLDSGFHIVMAELLDRKKSQKLTKKIKNLIKKVHDYEYEIE